MYKVITITTDGSGDAVGTVSIDRAALLYGIEYIKTDYVDGVDLTVTTGGSVLAKTLLTVTNMNAAEQFYLRDSSCGATGTVSTDALIMPPIFGNLTLTISQGGATKSGTFVVWYIEMD